LTYLAIAAAVLFAYFAIIKPLLYGVNVEEKNRLEAELAATRARIAESQQRANEELERLRKANEAKAAEVPPQPSEAELRAQAEAEEKERLKELMTKVQSMATDRPDELVRLLQAWLSSDDQATKKSG
jgi:flagellar biosynthesis/type III secretory pathway M-ring protein FliF/YscJ